MLDVTKPADNRVDLSLSGKIDEEEMRSGLTTLLDLSENVENGVMLYTIDEFDWPSLSAIMVEFRMFPRLFGLVRRFKRIALLTDTSWIANLAKLEGILIPGLTVKTFTRAEKDEALRWLSSSESG